MSNHTCDESLKLLDFTKNEINIIDNSDVSDQYRSFNIFNILDIKSKEVIMCRFLKELLSSNGAHGMGNKFYEKFIEVINDDRLKLSDDIKVTTEKVIKDNRRIDILIKTSKQIIPIEVKIYAGEQKNQVKDYLEYTEKYIKRNKLDCNNCVLLYLTLDGHHPSSYSNDSNDGHKSDDRLICISFKEHILNFLQKCLEECDCTESVRTNIKQYQFAVEELTGMSSLNDKVIKNVIEKINGKNEFVAIQYLETAQELRKIKLIRDIFESVERELIKEYPELDKNENLIRGYSEDGSKLFQHDTNLNNYYRSKSGKFPCLFWKYGQITYPDNDNIKLDVVIAFEINWRPYVGILLTCKNSKGKFYNLFDKDEVGKENGSFNPKDDSIIQKLKMELENKIEFSETSTWWIDWCRVSAVESFAEEKDAPDFKTAFSEDYFQLYDENIRENLVQNIVSRFKLYKEALDSLYDSKVIKKIVHEEV